MAKGDPANAIAMCPVSHQAVAGIAGGGLQITVTIPIIPKQRIMRNARLGTKRSDPRRLPVRPVAQTMINSYSGNQVSGLGRPAGKQMQQRHAVTATRHGDTNFGWAGWKCFSDPMNKPDIITRRRA